MCKVRVRRVLREVGGQLPGDYEGLMRWFCEAWDKALTDELEAPLFMIGGEISLVFLQEETERQATFRKSNEAIERRKELAELARLKTKYPSHV